MGGGVRTCARVCCPGGGHAGPCPPRFLMARPLSYVAPPLQRAPGTAAPANAPGHLVSHRGDLWGCKAECCGWLSP